MLVHVDDGLCFLDEDFVSVLKEALESRFLVKFKQVEQGEKVVFCGKTLCEDEGGLRISQHDYISTRSLIPISKERTKQAQSLITEEERSWLRKLVGELRWESKSVWDIVYDVHKASSWQGSDQCKVETLTRVNKVARYVMQGRRAHDGKATVQSLYIPRLAEDIEYKVVAIVDVAEARDDVQYQGKWQSCYVIGLQQDDQYEDKHFAQCWDYTEEALFCPITIKAGTTRRTANSSYDGESLTAMEACDVCLNLSTQCEEAEFGMQATLWSQFVLNKLGQMEDVGYKDAKRISFEIHTDCMDLVRASSKLTLPQGESKRRKGDLADIQELQSLRKLRPLVHVAGKTNPANAGTKFLSFEEQTMSRLRSVTQGFYSPDI